MKNNTTLLCVGREKRARHIGQASNKMKSPVGLQGGV